jgi:hypothetical protein
MPLLRQLVAQIASHLLGPKHAAAALEAQARDAQQLREMNPRAFRFDVVEGNINEEFGQEIVFEVGEYTAERRSRHVNDDIAMTMERVDAPLSFSQ